MDYRLTNEKNGISIEFRVISVNQDILIIVAGGDLPHIGSVSIGNSEKGTTSIFIPEHKDHFITSSMLKIISNSISSNICILGGVHIDDITQEQIELVLQMCNEAAEEIIRHLITNGY